jgi:hypothetical protein
MKQLRFIGVALLTVLMSVSFSACSSSDDDDDNGGSSSNPIVGTWYTEGEEKGYSTYTEITYNADYTCTWREYNSDKTTIKESDSGKYKVEGSTLSIWWNSEKKYWDTDGPWTTIFTISGNKMTTTEAGGTTWTRK